MSDLYSWKVFEDLRRMSPAQRKAALRVIDVVCRDPTAERSGRRALADSPYIPGAFAFRRGGVTIYYKISGADVTILRVFCE